MAEGVNVRLTGKLRKYVKMKSDPDQGFFNSASEYIRDLVRHDFEENESLKWKFLREELATGLRTDESEFAEVDASQIIAEAKKRKAAISDGS